MTHLFGLSPSFNEVLATVIFALAVIHTFLCSRFQHLAHQYDEGSIQENLYHMLGEVEVVFGLWAGIFLLIFSFTSGTHAAIEYAESLNFTEPLFVFAVMATAATAPIIAAARSLIMGLSKVLPLNRETAVYLTCLTVGPLLGSFITEPAAMTVTALLLRDRYFNANSSLRFKYLTIAVLFVNVSIGGVLTSFAAPPVLMVASVWGWTNSFMLQTFGWKAALAVFSNAMIAVFLLKSELKTLIIPPQKVRVSIPYWLTLIHLLALGLIVMTAHHPVIFIGFFLFFIGIASITKEFQTGLMIKQSLLVGFFLGGLVVLGGLQGWWLAPVLSAMNETTLFFGTTTMTAITDNAAITYLGSRLPDLPFNFKYALVAGAVAGGGLTVIANAPNPAGFAVLQGSFGPDGISPAKLLLAALLPTSMALLYFWLL